MPIILVDNKAHSQFKCYTDKPFQRLVKLDCRRVRGLKLKSVSDVTEKIVCIIAVQTLIFIPLIICLYHMEIAF